MQSTPMEKINQYTSQGYWGKSTLDTLFRRCLASHSDKLALLDPLNREDLVPGPPQRLSFADLDQKTDELVTRLYQAGLRQGDVLLVQMPNTVELVISYLAATRLGLILSPIAMQYGRHELTQIVQTTQPSGFLKFSSFKGEPFAENCEDILGQSCQIINIDQGPTASAELTQTATAYTASFDASSNDIITICWTSGTTGRPKGVPRSHNHWMAIMVASADAVPLKESDVILNPFPFINMAAIGGMLYLWLEKGVTLALHHPFDPLVYLKQIQLEKVAYTLAPPPVLLHLLAQKDQIKAAFDLSNLRVIASGSAPLAPIMIEGIKREFGIETVNLFGSNEGVALASCPREVPDPTARAQYFPRFGREEFSWNNRISSMSRTKLVGLDSGEEITQPGQPGELLITGPMVFDGYYKSPEDNAQAFSEDGYFHSGDLFEIAGENNQFYRFVGRCKNVIIRGGVNISPEELDDVLLKHPDVAEAAVVGYQDERLGEKVAAALVLKPESSMSLEQLRTYLQEQGLAKFKWPEKLIILGQLPRNPMNKVVRSQINDLLLEQV